MSEGSFFRCLELPAAFKKNYSESFQATFLERKEKGMGKKETVNLFIEILHCQATMHHSLMI
jgi:hypothetical protein